MMKKFFAILLTVCLSLTLLCGCGEEASTPTPAPTATPDPTPTPDPRLGTLIVDNASPAMQEGLRLADDLMGAYSSYTIASISGAAEAEGYMDTIKNDVKAIDDLMQTLSEEERASFEAYYKEMLSGMDISVDEILAEFATPEPEEVPADDDAPAEDAPAAE